ncbi:sugar ABC transporter permease [Lachnospiraceae bacterium ASD4241]|uniref:Sugar ABC transporter permease n=2 Tax=Diplocloster modestus TaxID=2850322 RepID=A0ABS6K8K4_9FIRM|nr:sugar ABC transporter permease [Diplocloster modestus]MBU9726843.1 sugar ABC transporter permease [Diplocloster modestus]
MRHRKRYDGALFLLPSLLGVSTFLIVPFLDVIRRSFTDVIGENFVGLQNYRTIFQTSAFQLASANTFKFVLVCIPLLLLLSLIIAVILTESFGNKSRLKHAYLIPMAIPVASIVLFWRVVFDKQGLLNGILAQFGIPGTDWMKESTAFVILVGSYIWKNLGYNIVLWTAGLTSIPRSLYEAAAVDGAGWWKKFRCITLPNLRSVLCTISVLAFLNSFKVFREAYLVAGDYPDESMYLLQHLFNNWFRELSLDKLSAAAIVVSMIIFLGIRLLEKFWDQEEQCR